MASEQRTTMTIGRSAQCGLVLNEPSMSRVHAEVTLTRSGRVFVIDRLSSQGTFFANGDELVAIRQSFVEPDEVVFFGELGLSGDELRQYVEGRATSGRSRTNGEGEEQAQPRRRPEWDPESGEIIDKKTR